MTRDGIIQAEFQELVEDLIDMGFREDEILIALEALHADLEDSISAYA